jgi:excisionase family DNA binding protein
MDRRILALLADENEDEKRPRSRRCMSLKAMDLFSVDETAATLGIARGTVRNWLSKKRIEYVKLGRRTLITRRALERFIESQTVRAVENATAPPTSERQ